MNNDNLNKAFYIDKHPNSQSLNGCWEYNFYNEDKALKDITYKFTANLPASTYKCLKESNLLPDYFKGTNSTLYRNVRNQVFYFKRLFKIDHVGKEENKQIYLCFDGASYYTDIYINGTLIGTHIGQTGGPCINITNFVNKNSENEIVLGVKSAVYGTDESFNPFGDNGLISTWAYTGVNLWSNGDYVAHGIWNDIRLEFVEKVHISRPFLYTKNVNTRYAKLKLSLELTNELFDELDVKKGYYEGCSTITRAFDNGITGKKKNSSVELRFRMSDETGTAIDNTEKINLLDYKNSLITPKFYECQYIEKDFIIKNPKLWYPAAIGEPHLYKTEIFLIKDGDIIDYHTFDFGIRTLELDYTAGDRYNLDRQKYRFIINGKGFFARGINCMPIDVLHDMDKEKYDWFLNLIKKANIWLIRLWGGASIYETDYFYKRCDELGILVWQDSLIANTTASTWDLKILDSAVSYNVYRIRNHPSLAVYCGGNEFNPYHVLNSGALGKIKQTTSMIDPTRHFYETSSLGGSAHIYNDMEPTRYRKAYKALPFLAEAGIHSFPSYTALKGIVAENELEGPIDNLSVEYLNSHPELVNHIAENDAEHISRMLNRVTQLIDTKNSDLKTLCKASQLAAAEYYQIMCEAMIENFPKTGGIIPWVFSRPYVSVGVQLIDSAGFPLSQYYSIKNVFENITANLCLSEISYAAGETFLLKAAVINHLEKSTNITVTAKVYSPLLKLVYCNTEEIAISLYKKFLPLGEFKIPNEYTDKFFFVTLHIKGDGFESHKIYKPKVLALLSSPKFRKDFRSGMQPNFVFDDKALKQKEQIESLKTTVKLNVEKVSDKTYMLSIKNCGSYPAYPVSIESNTPFYASDNDMFIEPEELRTILVEFRGAIPKNITISCWNSKSINQRIK